MKPKYITCKITVKVPYIPGHTESMKTAAEYVEALKDAVLGDDPNLVISGQPKDTLIEFKA
jgi:hypothetical protein